MNRYENVYVGSRGPENGVMEQTPQTIESPRASGAAAQPMFVLASQLLRFGDVAQPLRLARNFP
jgi:hypothetical protein